VAPMIAYINMITPPNRHTRVLYQGGALPSRHRCSHPSNQLFHFKNLRSSAQSADSKTRQGLSMLHALRGALLGAMLTRGGGLWPYPALRCCNPFGIGTLSTNESAKRDHLHRHARRRVSSGAQGATPHHLYLPPTVRPTKAGI